MSKVTRMLKVLQEDGAQPEEVDAVVEEMGKSAAVELYTHLVSLVDESDLKIIESVSEDDDEAASKIVNDLYLKYEGKTASQALDEINDRFAEAFLDNYGV